MEEFCDVTLISEDYKRVRAHRVVLASASSFLRDMFQNEEEEYQVIMMPGVSSNFMSAMVEIIYNGQTKLEVENCADFLNILKKYTVLEDKVKQKCRYFNRGCCKKGSRCDYSNLDQDCEIHMLGENCNDKKCTGRHRNICKYWKTKEGCFRRNQCHY